MAPSGDLISVLSSDGSASGRPSAARLPLRGAERSRCSQADTLSVISDVVAVSDGGFIFAQVKYRIKCKVSVIRDVSD